MNELMNRVATNLENVHGKPGQLREFENCQNFMENSGKFEFL